MTERKRPERRGQDPSGHISMDTSESAFFDRIQKRFAQIELAKQSGTMKYAAYRNPLRGEKTPRKDWLINYDYSIPPLPDHMKKEEKWVYPDSDWGIMGKFASQKPVYQSIYDREQNMKNMIEAFRASKAVQSQEGDTTERTGDGRSGSSINNNNNMNSSREYTKDTTGTEFTRTDYYAGSSDSTPRHSARLGADPRRIVDEYAPATASANALLSTQKVSSLKSLSTSNPEILAKWRATRAASYVVKQKHPLEPPIQRDLTSRPFKPSGTLTTDSSGEVVIAAIRGGRKEGRSKRGGGAGGSSGPIESSRTGGSLGPLLDALKKTESEIERQELLIALSKAKK